MPHGEEGDGQAGAEEDDEVGRQLEPRRGLILMLPFPIFYFYFFPTILLLLQLLIMTCC